MQTGNEHSGHRGRMRARIARTGLKSLTEHEILEVLLYYAQPRGDTNSLAHRLLDRFGSLARVLDADPASLQQVDGVGPSVAFLLNFSAQLSARYFQDKTQARPIFGSNRAFLAYIQTLFLAEVREVVYLVCLDNNMRLINCLKLAEGARAEVAIPLDEVVRTAVSQGARNVVLAHNHPSARLKPSDADLRLTQQCLAALALVNIELLDHFIVCGSDYFSFAEHSYMDAMRKSVGLVNPA